MWKCKQNFSQRECWLQVCHPLPGVLLKEVPLNSSCKSKFLLRNTSHLPWLFARGNHDVVERTIVLEAENLGLIPVSSSIIRYYLLTSNSEGCLNGACEFHSRNSVYLFVLKQKTPFLITRIQNTVISQVMFALLLKQLTFIECLLYSLC